MIDPQNSIKVTIIRNAAGFRAGSTSAGCRDGAITYYTAARLSTELPSLCGSNTKDFYDPAMPKKVINIMNYFGAPSKDFIPFFSHDLTNILDLQCELEAGDELICVWAPLVTLDKDLLVDQPKLVPIANKVVPPQPAPAPVSVPAPKPNANLILVRQSDGSSKIVKAK